MHTKEVIDNTVVSVSERKLLEEGNVDVTPSLAVAHTLMTAMGSVQGAVVNNVTDDPDADEINALIDRLKKLEKEEADIKQQYQKLIAQAAAMKDRGAALIMMFGAMSDLGYDQIEGGSLQGYGIQSQIAGVFNKIMTTVLGDLNAQKAAADPAKAADLVKALNTIQTLANGPEGKSFFGEDGVANINSYCNNVLGQLPDVAHDPTGADAAAKLHAFWQELDTQDIKGIMDPVNNLENTVGTLGTMTQQEISNTTNKMQQLLSFLKVMEAFLKNANQGPVSALSQVGN